MCREKLKCANKLYVLYQIYHTGALKLTYAKTLFCPINASQISENLPKIEKINNDGDH